MCLVGCVFINAFSVSIPIVLVSMHCIMVTGKYDLASATQDYTQYCRL